MNPLTRTLGGLGLGIAALGAGAVAALATRHHALAPESGETYEPVPSEERFVHADDGVRLHVEVSEPPEGAHPDLPTIVLCHGYTLSAKSWIFVRRALATAGYRVVAWDQRGHGQSAAGPAEGYSIRQLGRDLRAVVDAVAPDGDLVLVGHSMGGMTLMAFGAQYTELVRRRVLAVAFVATSAGGPGDLAVQLGDTMGRLAQKIGANVLTPLGEHPGVVAAARRGARELEDAITYRYSYASPVPPSLLRYTADIILGTPIDVMAALLGPISVHDEHEGLRAFAGIETLVINGTGDLLTPPKHSDEIVRVLPQAEHVVVQDAGHLLMLEHPAVLVEQLEALVDRARRERPDEPAHGRLVEVGQPRPSTTQDLRRTVVRASARARHGLSAQPRARRRTRRGRSSR